MCWLSANCNKKKQNAGKTWQKNNGCAGLWYGIPSARHLLRVDMGLLLYTYKILTLKIVFHLSIDSGGRNRVFGL
jgi:hypothetical protein